MTSYCCGRFRQLCTEHRIECRHHLRPENVPQSRSDDPMMAERVTHAPRAIAVELVGDWIDLLGAGFERDSENRICVSDMQKQDD